LIFLSLQLSWGSVNLTLAQYTIGSNTKEGTIQNQAATMVNIKAFDTYKIQTSGGRVKYYYFESITFSEGTVTVILTIQRENATPDEIYKVTFRLKKEGQDWKIMNANDI
jgi:hypothetical protein